MNDAIVREDLITGLRRARGVLTHVLDRIEEDKLARLPTRGAGGLQDLFANVVNGIDELFEVLDDLS